MYRLESVCFSYSEDGSPLFQNLDLEIPAHESFVLVGPSGAGKSTLLRMMVGLIPPTSGQVKFEGRDINQMTRSERESFLRRVGMTFQNSGLFDSMTSGENLELPLTEAKKTAQSDLKNRILAGLREVGLESAVEKFPHELSGGMRKRLSIARSLVLNPEVILYDEPTAGLDPITSRDIANLILESKKKYQMTSIVVTSDLGLASQVGDRLGFLYRGKILETGDFGALKKSRLPEVRQFMLGSETGPLTEHA